MKNILTRLKDALVWILVAVAIGMMIFTVISVTTFDRNERQIFGYKMFVVRSDSMSATDFAAGDIIFVREVEPSKLKEGDIISFISNDRENYGETVTHKIRRLTTDADGAPGFITYGTTTGNDDKAVVTYSYVLGKYVGKLPKAGYFFQFLKSTKGYFSCILIPFLLLIIYQGVNCYRLFKQYKKEQMDEMQAERDKLEEERRQTAAMMEELRALRAQMEMKSTQEDGKQVVGSSECSAKEANSDDIECGG